MSLAQSMVRRSLRILPHGLPGRTRIAALACRRLLADGACDIPAAGIGIVRVPSLREPIALHLFSSGQYEPALLELIAQRLRPGDTFIDVGANVGVFTLFASRIVGPTGRVIAVEASPEIANYLRHNVSANDCRNVTLCAVAVGDRDGGTIDFYPAPSSHFGMGSLAAAFHDHPIPVPIRTLDSLLRELGVNQAKLMKVDVEGYEAAVFRGAVSSLRSGVIPTVVFEFCDWAENRAVPMSYGAAQQFIADCGFNLQQLADKPGKPLIDLAAPLTQGGAGIVATRRGPAK